MAYGLAKIHEENLMVNKRTIKLAVTAGFQHNNNNFPIGGIGNKPKMTVKDLSPTNEGEEGKVSHPMRVLTFKLSL